MKHLIGLAVLLLISGCIDDKGNISAPPQHTSFIPEVTNEEIISQGEESSLPRSDDSNEGTEEEDLGSDCRELVTAEGTLKICATSTQFIWLVGGPMDLSVKDPCNGDQTGDDEILFYDAQEKDYYRVYSGLLAIHFGKILDKVEQISSDSDYSEEGPCVYLIRPEPFNDIQRTRIW